MTGGYDDWTNAELVRAYEGIRRVPGAARDALRRELERRAHRAGSVADADRGVEYAWDDADESVVRRDLAPAVLKMKEAAAREAEKRRQRLGALALSGPARPLSRAAGE